MITVEEIRKRSKYFKDELYSKVRTEQTLDLEYINDTFRVPEIIAPHTPRRLGFGRRMVDAPAEEIITANPQVFVKVLTGLQEGEFRFGTMFNQWIDILRRQNPNPFKEFVKNLLARGEAYIKLAHNEGWVTGEKEKIGLPVHFLIPDPMVIYGSQYEDENGIPEEVFTLYERQPEEVLVRYPHWLNPKGAGVKGGKNEKGKVVWLEYCKKDYRYWEADEEAVLKGGIQPNPYLFVPSIRKLSGFGKRSPSGELADLIVSDIRFSRGLLYDECLTGSDLSSIIHLFAHSPVTILARGAVNDESIRENFRLGAYVVNILDNLGEGFDVRIGERIQPTPEMFSHYDRILNQLNQRCPFLMAGFPMGTSGRQEAMTLTAGMRRYLTIIENTQNAFATAFERAFEIIKAIPTLKPDELNERDLESVIKCEVKLKAADPIEEDRLATLGSRLLTQKEIDPMTNLIEYQGRTTERAREILIDVLKWDVILNSPEIRALIGRRAAEKSGMLEDLMGAQAQRQQLEKQATLGGEVPPTGMQRTMGEVQTQVGREMSPEPGRGARVPPEAYTRGGA